MGEIERVERVEMLDALESSRARVLEVMFMMEPLVRVMAAEGNPLAAYLVDELEEARTAMQSENVAASSFLAEAGRG